MIYWLIVCLRKLKTAFKGRNSSLSTFKRDYAWFDSKGAEERQKKRQPLHPARWTFAGSGATPDLKEDLSFPMVFEVRGCGVFVWYAVSFAKHRLQLFERA